MTEGPFIPWFVAGTTSGLLPALITKWLPYYVAFGLGFFVASGAAALVVSRSGSQRHFRHALVSSAVGALIAGFFAFVLDVGP
ncbi:MAG: hypothetical protein ACM3SQ_03510 [Betaproteobacteria bacterium]